MPNAKVSSDRVVIEAPRELVWSILIDTPRYEEWNPFTYRVDTSLQVGDKVDLYVRMARRGEFLQRERVEDVSPPYRLAWGMELGFAFLLRACREQCIERLSETSCAYQTTDNFAGWLAPLVLAIFQEDIRLGFNGVAYALKKRAERVWGERKQLRRNRDYSAFA